MAVKVIILNWNGAAMLPRFLPSVIAATPCEVEIVVADNGSTDDSVELLRRDFPTVRIIELDRNYGFAGGYNRALKAMENGFQTSESQDKRSLENPTNDDVYILLNSDVETPAGWTEPLVNLLMNNPEVGAVAPKILSFSDKSRFEYAGASGGFIDALGYPFCRGRILETVETDAGQYDDALVTFWATGACMACRAHAFWEVGGFDERFFAHQEEIDLCWRMQLRGHRIMVEPRSKVFHLGGGTLPPSPQKLYLNYRNNMAMLYKNLGRSMPFVIIIRLVLNCLSSIAYLLQGKPRNFIAVHRAHLDFIRMRLSGSRKQIQSSRIASPKGIYLGWIVVSARKFSSLKRIK